MDFDDPLQHGEDSCIQSITINNVDEGEKSLALRFHDLDLAEFENVKAGGPHRSQHSKGGVEMPSILGGDIRKWT
jgi:hypothetical protein